MRVCRGKQSTARRCFRLGTPSSPCPRSLRSSRAAACGGVLAAAAAATVRTTAFGSHRLLERPKHAVSKCPAFVSCGHGKQCIEIPHSGLEA